MNGSRDSHAGHTTKLASFRLCQKSLLIRESANGYTFIHVIMETVSHIAQVFSSWGRHPAFCYKSWQFLIWSEHRQILHPWSTRSMHSHTPGFHAGHQFPLTLVGLPVMIRLIDRVACHRITTFSLGTPSFGTFLISSLPITLVRSTISVSLSFPVEFVTFYLFNAQDFASVRSTCMVERSAVYPLAPAIRSPEHFCGTIVSTVGTKISAELVRAPRLRMLYESAIVGPVLHEALPQSFLHTVAPAALYPRPCDRSTAF